MRAWLRSWKGGLAVAAACLVAGVVRMANTPGDADWLVWASFVLAVGYGYAGFGRHPTQVAWVEARETRRGADRGAVRVLTWDRVGVALAVVAAVVGLALVFNGRESGASENPTPAGSAPTGQVPISQVQPPVVPPQDG